MPRSARADLALITVAKLLVSAFVLAIGFRAVSDDDYARVAIAQAFARAPNLDPTGTSWLPAPFWLLGAWFAAFGRSLLAAQIHAGILGVVSMWIVYVAARWMTDDRGTALVGTLVACATSWSAMLGVSTVPELPTAALMLLAIGAISSEGPARGARVAIGGAALFVACLSRYEPWFVAIPFVFFVARDLVRERDRPTVGARRALAIALAVAGPIGWILWNRAAHGAPLHFLAMVVDYHDAIRAPSRLARAGVYAYAALRAEPELVAALAFLLVRLGAERRRAVARPFARAIGVGLFLLVALTASNVGGGAPTHHPERALLVLFLVASLLTGRAIVEIARAPSPQNLLSRSHAAIALAAIAALSFPVRRFVLRSEVLADRALEVDIGERAAARIAAGTKVHVDVVDYGYFAIQAATGRPEDFVPNTAKDLGGLGLPAVALDAFSEAETSGLPYAIVRASSAPFDVTPLEKNDAWVLVEMNDREAKGAPPGGNVRDP